jgi:hypothetical protein
MLNKNLIFAALLSIAAVAAVADINDDFGSDCLFAHNLYRKLHGVPALKLSPTLSKLAMSRARELADMEELNVKQNKFHGQALGETVGSVGGFSHYNGISATQLWYSVVSKFDEEGELSSEGASFTQIVWKSTQLVGFGIAKSRSGKFFFVAEYFPSGNIRHKYEDNVFQLTDEELVKPVDCPAKVSSSAHHTTSTHTEIIKPNAAANLTQVEPVRVTANNAAAAAATVADEVTEAKPKKEDIDAEVSKVFTVATTTTEATTTTTSTAEQVESDEATTTRQMIITTTAINDYEMEPESTTTTTKKSIVHHHAKSAKTTTEAINVVNQEEEVEATTINSNRITLPPPAEDEYVLDDITTTTTTTMTTTTTTTVAPIRHAKTTTISSGEEYDIDYEEPLTTTTKTIRNKVPVVTTTTTEETTTTTTTTTTTATTTTVEAVTQRVTTTESDLQYEDEPIVPTKTSTTTTVESVVEDIVEPEVTTTVQNKVRHGRRHHLKKKKTE